MLQNEIRRTCYTAKLTKSHNVLLNIAPTELIVYNKEVQTIKSSFDKPQPLEEEIRDQVLKEIEAEQKAKHIALEEEEQSLHKEQDKLLKETELPKETRELSEEEKTAIMSDQNFADFMDATSKLVERALNERYDIMKDYTSDFDADVSEELKFLCEFRDEKWSKNRSVTDVGWSKKVRI